ncbi:MAG: glycosyltransferase family 39 protein [bacterium]|nr:glycosyltransferase family 39 protein [bacterium]
MIPSQLRFRSAIIAFAVLLVGIVILVLIPAPYVVETVNGSAHIRLTIDRTRVLTQSGCVNVRWNVQGIREIFLNDEGTVGEGERSICGVPPAVTFHIGLQTGESLDYAAPILIFDRSGWFWVGALLTGLVGLYAASAHVEWGRVRQTLRSAAAYGLRYPAAAVALITLSGAALRWTSLTTESLWLDETMLFHIAYRNTLADVTLANAGSNSAPPLFAWMLALVLQHDTSEVMTRSISLAAGILTIPLSYLLARQYMGRTSALLVALLFASAPSQIRYAQEVREYALSVLVMVGLLYSFNRFFRRPSPLNGLLYLVVSATAIFTQYGLALVIAALNGVVLVDLLRRPVRWRWLAGWVGVQAGTTAAAFAVYMLALRTQWVSGGFAGVGYLAAAYGDGTLHSLMQLATQSTWELIQFAFPGGVFALLAILGLAAVVRGPRWINGLTLWGVIVVSLFAAFLRYYPYHGGRQNIFLAVPLILLAGIGFSRLRAALRSRPSAAWISGVTVLILAITGVIGAVTQQNTLSPRQTRQAMDYLQANFQDGDRIYVHQYAHITYDYYRLQGMMAGLPEPIIGESPHGNAYLTDLPALIREEGRLWMLIAECSEICLREHTRHVSGGRTVIWAFDTDETGILLLP